MRIKRARTCQPRTHFRVEEAVRGRSHTVRVVGEIDADSAPRLAGTLARISPHAAEIVLDLSDVTFIDSAGLRALLTAKAVCAEHCVELVLAAGAQPPQRRPLPVDHSTVAGEAVVWRDPETSRVGCGPCGAGTAPPAEGR